MMPRISRYRYLPAILVVMILLVFIGCNGSGKTDEKATVYTCPMHPEIRKNEPGNCPICKMRLVPVTPDKKADTVDIRHLLDPTNNVVISKIEAIKPSRSAQQYSIQVNGVIAYDERLSNSISARVDGRIEKLYAKYRFQSIAVGQRLFDLYSPELLNEQQNFIFLLKNEREDKGIVSSARAKLLLAGLNEDQIRQIELTREIISPVPFYSAYAGHLHISPKGASGNDMNSMPAAPADASNIEILKEGMYVKKGQVIFQINNTSRVWALLNLNVKDAWAVKVGTHVSILVKGETIPAQVDFIEPVLKDGQNLITARVYLENSRDHLEIGENITAILRSTSAQSLFLPSHSVVSLGLRHIVFVKNGSRYVAKEVHIGSDYGGMVEVVSGLDSNAMVAKNASYLVDSESFVSPND